MAARRRSRGEGTIGEFTRGGTLYYVARVSAGRSASGRRQRLERWCRTNAEAIKALRALQIEAEKSTTRSDRAPANLASYLEGWLEDTVKERRRSSTYVRYAALLRKHVIPYVRGIPIARFGPDDAAALYRRIRREGASDSTVHKAHRVLKRALQPAVRQGFIHANPLEQLHEDETPRYQPAERPILTPEQLTTFLDAVRGDEFEALYVLAVSAHLREGELFALQTDQLDLKAGTVIVRRTVRDGLTSKPELGDTTKTESSRNGIVLPKMAVAALRAHLKRRMKGKVDSTYVFPGARGKPLRRSNFLRRKFYPLLDRAGLPRIHFHDLRHSSLSLLAEHGLDSRILQRRARHAQITTTEGLYVHLDVSVQRIAADMLDRLLRPGRGAAAGDRAGTVGGKARTRRSP